MSNDCKLVSAMENGGKNQKVSAISQVLGLAPVLPGENEELYNNGLKGLISELDAKTVLQVYIAEKIFDSLWWLRRYDEQKRAVILAEIAHQARVEYTPEAKALEEHMYNSLLHNNIDYKTSKTVKKSGKSLDSLRQKAMSSKQKDLLLLDEQIALQAKILSGLQASFEVAFNRKLNAERLMLQNQLLRNDLAAITVSPESAPNEKKH